MNDILPFRRKDFCGSLEVQERLIATSKVLRIQRLKEVRNKEKDVSDVGAEAYRKCIADRKAAKELNEKDKKRREKEQELQVLSKKWHNAVQESGDAHNRAKKNVDILLKKSENESRISARRREEQSQREKAAMKLRQEQILQTQRSTLRLLELQQVKREMRMSDREDAHAHGEAYAARQELRDCQREAIAHIHSVPVVYTQTRVQQGAVSIEQRFPVEVHAQVWRHGVAGAGGMVGAMGGQFRAEVRNGANVEEGTILRKNWSRVMVEMLTKIKTKKRAQTAKRTVEQHKGVLYLESELQRLEAADKAPSRQTRVCSALGVAPDAEAPRLQGSFEKMFLSKPVRIDHKHIVYHTGSHLKKSNLEKHVQHQLRQEEEQVEEEEEEEASLGRDRDVFEAHSEARNSFPTWHSEAPHSSFGLSTTAPHTSEYFAATRTIHAYHTSGDARSVRSDDSSGAASDELRMLSGGRMYQELDNCSTASDIPMISRPPPQWMSVHQDHSTELVEVTSSSQQHQHNVEVRIPQVQPRGQAQPPAKRSPAPASPSPSSPSSVATSPSTVATSTSSFSDAVSMKSNLGSETSSGGWAAPPPPLRIELKAVQDGGPTRGSVTPPRHQSSRGSAGGMRPIDPFTPPEVAPSSRQRQQQRDAEGTASPQSGASSTNTEQARHDRLQRFEPAAPAQSPSLHSAPAIRAALQQRSPLWTEDSDVDRSRQSVNISALTEQMTLHDSGDEGEELCEESLQSSDSDADSRSDRDSEFSNSSSSVSALRLAQRALSSSHSSASAASASSEEARALHSDSSSSNSRRLQAGSTLQALASSPLRSSTGTSRRSSRSSAPSAVHSSSASSSSSSMLSYLDSSKKPPAAVLSSEWGVTITIAGSTAGTTRVVGAPPPPLPPRMLLSPAQSLDSDSVSMLSATSDEIRFAAGQSLRDSFQQLTRQELQGVLDDLSSDDDDDDDDELEPAGHERVVGQRDERQSDLPGIYSKEYSTHVHTTAAVERTSATSTTEMSFNSGGGSGSGGSNRSRSAVSAPSIQDYASMFDSDSGESGSESEEGAVPAKVSAPPYLRQFPLLPHTIGRIEEESSDDEQRGTERAEKEEEHVDAVQEEGEEEEDGEELEQASLHSTSTGELFDNWQQLYRGTLQLGSQARAVRSEHVAAYNASAAAAAAGPSHGESFLSSQELSPPRQAAVRSSTATVPASPLNVLVFPQDGPEFSKSSLYVSDLRSSQSSQVSGKRDSDNDSHSSDSLSPRLDRYASTTRIIHRTSVDVRASSESGNRATALMSELDKLSQDWREKQAFYSKPHTALAAAHDTIAPSSPTPLSAPPAAAVRQPSEPPHFSSPSWHRPRSGADPALLAGHTPASLSSLSSVASPPSEPAAANSASLREVYSGRLHVHSEQRAYPVTAAHLPELAAQLELEDSMNSSSHNSSSFLSGTHGSRATGKAGEARTLYSSDEEEQEDDESQDRSLEDLLNSRSGSETRGRIQSEIAAMRSRLLATVAAPTGAPRSGGSSGVAPSTAHLGSGQLRTHHSAEAASHAVASYNRSSSSSRSAAGAQSSGEDTYSSSKYYSAGEARNASDGTMHTPDSGADDEHDWRRGPRSQQLAPGVDVTLRASSHVTATLRSTATTSYVSSTTSRTVTSHVAQESSASSSSSSARGGSGGALQDDSGRAAAYSFTQRSAAPTAQNFTHPGAISATAAGVSSADSSLVLQQVGSPGGGSVSRLSEYAMLSQHTLQASPGSALGGESPSTSRLERRGDESHSYDMANNPNVSSTSDSSTFSEYMRHFPSRK